MSTSKYNDNHDAVMTYINAYITGSHDSENNLSLDVLRRDLSESLKEQGVNSEDISKVYLLAIKLLKLNTQCELSPDGKEFYGITLKRDALALERKEMEDDIARNRMIREYKDKGYVFNPETKLWQSPEDIAIENKVNGVEAE